MRSKRLPIRQKAFRSILVMTLLAASAWAAPREKVLYSFGNGNDGFQPLAGLVFDSSGNLYGTTFFGGTGTACHEDCGTVFEMIPKPGGGWTEKVLHNFGHGTDGSNPAGGLVFDASGNLYGTTSGGGAHGAGAVFELSPTSGGGWTEKVLHSFHDRDGLNPSSSLTFDAAGNLYSTTSYGGSGTDCYPSSGCGTVFELTPTSDGDWTEKVLHTFHKDRGGWFLTTGVIFDAAGNLYGTTVAGGDMKGCMGSGCGVVFELTPESDGSWSERVLHRFQGKDGADANDLIFDSSGNLYGTTIGGGRYSKFDCSLGCGLVFELTPTAGIWNEKLLHKFDNNHKDGLAPSGRLIFDAAGNLYGTTTYGGMYGPGTVFELTSTANGNWNEKVLHSFQDNSGDGQQPVAVVRDSAGNLFGTTESGGSVAGQGGAVFKVTP